MPDAKAPLPRRPCRQPVAPVRSGGARKRHFEAKSRDAAGLKGKFAAASKFADIDQLGIAPQCGFASTEEGNAITPDDQRRKLELVVNTAEAIWGGV